MRAPDQPTDAELLDSMSAGDEEAFAALYGRYQKSVYRFAAHISGSMTVAEDVTQEVFLVLMRIGARYDAERGSLQGFLLGIARNYVRRAMEKERACLSLDAEVRREEHGAVSHAARVWDAQAEGDNPFEQLARAEALGELYLSIRSLPEHYREALVLCGLQEMSYEEAAEVIGCAVGTVRSRLHRARQMLGEKLREGRSAPASETVIAGCFI